jgi:hypothetical protein
MRETRNTYRVLMEKPLGNSHWKIKMDLMERGEDGKWMKLA